MKRIILSAVICTVILLASGCASAEAQSTLQNVSMGVTAGMKLFKYTGFIRPCNSCHSQAPIEDALTPIPTTYYQ